MIMTKSYLEVNIWLGMTEPDEVEIFTTSTSRSNSSISRIFLDTEVL